MKFYGQDICYLHMDEWKGLFGYLGLWKGRRKPGTDLQNHKKIIFHKKNVFKIPWKFTDTLLLVVRWLQRVIYFTPHPILRTNALSNGITEVPQAMPKAVFTESLETLPFLQPAHISVSFKRPLIVWGSAAPKHSWNDLLRLPSGQFLSSSDQSQLSSWYHVTTNWLTSPWRNHSCYWA